MNNNFFIELFKYLQIPPQDHSKLLEALQEVARTNITSTILSSLTDQQKLSLKKYADNKPLDAELFLQWSKENNFSLDKELIEKIEEVSKKTLKEYFSILFVNLKDDEKNKVSNFINNYTQ